MGWGGAGARRRLRLAAGVVALAACGSGATSWEATGVVRALYPGEARVKIEHGDIEGLMPAMTMDFEVADPALLLGVETGHYIEFRIERDESRFEIVALRVPGGGSSGVGGGIEAPSDPLAGDDEPAPPFALVDQNGQRVALAELRGGPVVLDFVFTRCAGPCPILTGLLADVRDGLDAEQRPRVRFVSISLDPEYDTPERLRDYARARRLDTEGWSFLTGPRDEVDAVVRAYGVGSTPAADGSAQLEHTLATFLIDAEGRIARRYQGLRHEPETIRADIVDLL